MGRKRTTNHDLPPRMHRKGEAYYHVTSTTPRKWTCPDMAGLPVTAHAALLARVRLALMARGQAVVIEYATISA